MIRYRVFHEEDILLNYTTSLWYRSCEASHMRKISYWITQYHYDVVRVGHLIWGRYPIQSQNISMTSYVGGISYPTFCYFWCFFTINVTIESSISKKKAIIHILYFPRKNSKLGNVLLIFRSTRPRSCLGGTFSRVVDYKRKSSQKM